MKMNHIVFDRVNVFLNKKVLKDLMITRIMILLVVGILVHTGSASAFDTKHLTDELSFKGEIANSGVVWVRYETNEYSSATNDPKEVEKLSNDFWDVLKKEFGSQVDAFIIVNSTGWSNNGEATDKEIGQDFYPSFILYKDGKVVNDGTTNDIRLLGVGPKYRYSRRLDYIRSNCFLK